MVREQRAVDSIGEKKEISLYPSRSLAETPPATRESLIGVNKFALVLYIPGPRRMRPKEATQQLAFILF